LVNGLGAVTLGYGDRQVSNAVRKQLKRGTIFSLPGTLEAEVAEILVGLIPCAEKVRFAKNGTDATSAAIRLSRSLTKRNRIALCGYHGWQDWSIGTTTRNSGVPLETSNYSHPFKYNDIESLKSIFNKYPKEIAAVILEPMNNQFPDGNFLQEVRNICNDNGAILIFDETLTGFRVSKGGAQELFGVTPDLATFGKGMGNGFPISAIVGRAEIMNEMENIFFSGTFGGELLSLAASKVVLSRHAEDSVIPKLASIGENLSIAISKIIDKYQLNNVIQLTGHPSWKFLTWNPNLENLDSVKTLFLQEMFRQKILILNTHSISTALDRNSQNLVIEAYDETLSILRDGLENHTVEKLLKVSPLKPLFKIR